MGRHPKRILVCILLLFLFTSFLQVVRVSAEDVYTLTIIKVGNGDVTLDPPGGTYSLNDVVQLTANPADGWSFTGWSGDLSGSDNPESVTMDANKTVTVTFTQDEYTLTISYDGSGNGMVTKDPDQETYTYGTVVTLTAVPDGDSEFAGWSGDLTGTELSKDITMDDAKTVVATFNLKEYTLTVNIVGSGSVSKNPDQATYAHGTVVSLDPEPALGWSFAGWSGDLSGSADPESITMDGDKTVTATFTENPPVQYSLTVASAHGSPSPAVGVHLYDSGASVTCDVTSPVIEGSTVWTCTGWTGTGSVVSGSGVTTTFSITQNSTITWNWVSSPVQYSLTVNVVGNGSVTKSPDQATYDYGTVVTLTPQPAVGWSFSGWSGDLSGSANPAAITMDGNKTVTATFTQNQYTLTLNIVGNGSVTKVPNQSTYTYGTVVTLTPVPATGWIFSSWSGDLSGSGVPGSVTINGHKVVTATFIQIEYSLTVTISPPAGGSVSSNKSAPYHYGDIVALTANPTLGYSFTGWSGDGVGSNTTRIVTVTRNMAVVASFTQNQYILTLNTIGSGFITKSPDQSTYTYGTVVTLTPVASLGWTFSGWSGDLSGSGVPESVTMNANKSITANFTQNVYTLNVSVNPPEGGSVTVNPSGGTYLSGTVVTLTPVASSGWVFSGWSGDLSGSGVPGSVIMDGNKSVTAIFVQTGYSLTVNVAPPAGGTVTANKSAPYYYGDVVMLTASPASGYSFAGWSGDGAAGGGGTWVVIITGNMAVTVSFMQNEYTLTVNIVGDGSVTKTPNQVTYVYGTVVTLTPVAAPGWVFSGWSGDLSGGGTSGSITMSGNKSVSATFVQGTFSLRVISAYGNPNPDVGRYSYSSGSYVTCSVSSPVNVGGKVWACIGWTGTGSVPSSGGGLSTTFSISEDSSITWVWKIVQVERKLTVVSAYGSPDPSVGDHAYSDGESVVCSVLSPVSENGTIWVCTGWTGNGSVPSSGSGNNVTFIVIQDSLITWLWSEGSPPLPPTLSGPVDGEFVSSNNVTFSWVGSVWATGYEIEINGSSRIEIVYSTSYSAYFDSGVHTWRVREFNSTGYGDWSLPRSFTVTVPLVGTEAYFISILFGALLATVLIAYVFVYLRFGFISKRRPPG